MSVDAVVYTDEGTRTYDVADRVGPDARPLADELTATKRAQGTTWIRVTDPTEGELDAVREACELHPFAVEDVQHAAGPKVEEFNAYTFLLVKAARLRSGETTFEKEVGERPVGLFVGTDWLVTYTLDAVEAVERTWTRVEIEEGRLLERGPDFTPIASSTTTSPPSTTSKTASSSSRRKSSSRPTSNSSKSSTAPAGSSS